MGRSSGFTLIELMITVAIVAILAALAYPSYVEYVKRGKRAEARTLLLEDAQFMQRFYSANNRYDQKLDTTAMNSSLLPNTYSPQGASAGTAAYQFVLDTTALTATSYVLVATPINGMAGDPCVLTLTSTGARGIQGVTSPSDDLMNQCWSK